MLDRLKKMFDSLDFGFGCSKEVLLLGCPLGCLLFAMPLLVMCGGPAGIGIVQSIGSSAGSLMGIPDAPPTDDLRGSSVAPYDAP
jgi:hypothetical protein